MLRFAGVAKLDQNDLTKMLAAWADGDKDALDRVISVLYPEFRRIARQTLGRRAGESLESAALANEAYLKLISAGTIQCESRTHFLALCAQMSRRILVDHARREECEARRRCLFAADAVELLTCQVLARRGAAHGVQTSRCT